MSNTLYSIKRIGECQHEKGIEGFRVEPAVIDKESWIDGGESPGEQSNAFPKQIFCKQVNKHTGPRTKKGEKKARIEILWSGDEIDHGHNKGPERGTISNQTMRGVAEAMVSYQVLSQVIVDSCVILWNIVSCDSQIVDNTDE